MFSIIKLVLFISSVIIRKAASIIVEVKIGDSGNCQEEMHPCFYVVDIRT
jgi:hypothetical protein